MKKFLLFNTIALFLCLFVVVVLSVPYLFSKISPYSSLGFFSVVEEDFKSNFNRNYYKELLKGEKITGTFIASENDIGIILVRFYNFEKISSDAVIFRLKEENQKKWYYEYPYKVDQFQPNQYFTFGFPQIPDSKNKKYLFELESSAGKERNAIAISKYNPTVAYVYQYSKTKFFEDKKTLLQFSTKKVKYALDNFDKKKLIVFYLLFITTIIILFEVVIKRGKKILFFISKRFIRWWNLIKSVNFKPFLAKIKKIMNDLYAPLRFLVKFFSETFMTKRNKRIFPFIILAIAVLFSLGKTLQYYFFTDDYALLYHLQHNYSYGWPYQYLVNIFSIPFRFFGINPEGYFALGIFTFYLTVLADYFLMLLLTRSKLTALLSALIFSTAYIGIDHFGLIISSTDNISNLNICLTLIFFILWLDRKKIKYYFISLLWFWFSIVLLPIRAFPLVLFVPIVGIVLTVKIHRSVLSIKFLISRIIAFLPFLIIAYSNGIFSYGQKAAVTSVIPNFSNYKILELLNYNSIQEIFAILGRFILLKPFLNLFGPVLSPPYYLFGIILFILCVLVVILAFKNYERLGRSLLIVFLMTIAGYIGYWFLLPIFDSNGEVNRYLSTSFLGYSAVFPIVSYIIFKKISIIPKIGKLGFLIFIPVLIIMFTMISLSRNFEENNIRERSVPAKDFFKQLKSYLPSISGKNVFYFDYADHYPVAPRFGNIILGAYMPKETNFAVFYRVPLETIKIVDNIDALTTTLKNKEVDINHTHTFYYDEQGLHQTELMK